jgi:hypothetical protein
MEKHQTLQKKTKNGTPNKVLVAGELKKEDTSIENNAPVCPCSIFSNKRPKMVFISIFKGKYQLACHQNRV